MNSKIYEPFLESKNIYFIPFDEDLDDNYLKWVNDRKIIEHLITGVFPKSKQELVEYVKTINSNPNHVFFKVIEKETKKYIGNAKLGPIDWVNRSAEYGRMIGEKSVHGMGYGKEIARLLLHYAFKILNLNKITAGSPVDNIASIKSNESVGLIVEGRLKEQIFKDGAYLDVVRMGITKNRYIQKLNINNKN